MKQYKVGFSGTREGMSAFQKEKLRNILINLDFPIIEFHHGDCVGADSEAHSIADSLSIPKIVVHPPDIPRYRAFKSSVRVGSNITILEEKPYLERNRDIVDTTDLIFIAPSENISRNRSGTWYTKRYAESLHKTCIILAR